MILMSYGNSEGTRRCDARCYEGTGDHCDCICGGKNHGAGLQQAMQNVREQWEPVLKAMAAAEDAGAPRVYVCAEIRQQVLL